jgi:hypothetical protein
MNIYEKKIIQMVRRCVAYLNRYESKWRSFKVIEAEYQQLLACEAEISKLEQVTLTQSSRAEIAQRRIDSELLAEHIYKLICRLLLYAHNTRNVALAKQVQISESKLKEQNPEKLITTCQAFLKVANGYVDTASEYQITREELQRLEEALNSFKQRPIAVINVNSESRMATQSVKSTIKSTREVLQKLDMGIKGLADDATFIAGWNDVRRLKGLSSGKKKEAETIENKISTASQPLNEN